MQFKEVIGQQKTKQKLTHAISQHKIAHAQLFSGIAGCGTLPLALAYAQYLLCTDRKGDDSCGECPSCVKSKQYIHPDIHYVYPIVKGKFQNPICENYLPQWRSQLEDDMYFDLQDWYSRIGAENAQGTIYSGESNEIIRKMQMKSFESEYKVMIIWMPELMNETCSNKLLKMIEEPPAKTLFILVSENTERMITTIRSRVQLIPVPPLQGEEVAQYLMSKQQINPDLAGRYGRLSGGSIIAARHLCESLNQENDLLELFTYLMRKAYAKDIVGLKSWVDEMGEMGREKQKTFLMYAQRMIRENFILNMQRPSELNYMNESEQAFSLRFSPFINERNVFPLMEELGLAQMHVEHNVNSKMIFFDLSLKVIMLLKN